MNELFSFTPFSACSIAILAIISFGGWNCVINAFHVIYQTPQYWVTLAREGTHKRERERQHAREHVCIFREKDGASLYL